ncbi:lysylphosphatidylglycerol synthase transmembrane domain-containing protein [Gracilinema caldarium]|uniref:lysylphosphatidylglycerol synthase transmembrane domain-containing protein n=1 Tax=Gracilinema caldarium TaxID=215591 RepID=UPI0026F05628|nr:lysylphosphatidylglycerol synthase transmembrane domain-containing protein [Gracilinema caldarium]
MNAERKKLIRSMFLAVLIGFLANLGIAFLMDFNDIVGAIKKVDYSIVLVPFACYFIIYIVDSIRLIMVLWQFNIRIPLWEAFYNSVNVSLFSNLTPFSSGGQPFQILHLTSIGIDSKKATNIVLSRHVEFMFTAFFIFMISIPTAVGLANSMKIGREPMYIGFIVSLAMSLFFLFTLIKPDTISRFVLKFQKTRIGHWLGKKLKKEDWAEVFHNWATSLKEEVGFLWAEKTIIMIADLLLGLFNLTLQAFSVYYVLWRLTPIESTFFHVMATFVIINLVIYYIPIPGGSGSIEGSYIWIFSGMNNAPAATTVAIVLWRFATYYLHILFGLGIFFVHSYIHDRNQKKLIISV